MNIIKSIFTRLNISIAVILLQISIIIRLVTTVVNHMPIVIGVSYFISIAIILWLVIKDQSSGIKITWILVVIALPISGVVLYLLFGNQYPPKKTRKKLTAEHEELRKLLKVKSRFHTPIVGITDYIKNAGGFRAYQDTKSTYYPLGKDFFADMIEHLKKAEKFIFMEYFIIEEGTLWDEIYEVLKYKASGGVEIRIIFDDLISQRLFTNKYEINMWSKQIKTLRYNPIQIVFHPFMNYRNHRKLTVIDGKIAYTGAANITDPSVYPTEKFGVWKDTGIKLEGTAVWSFTLMFIEIWNSFSRTSDRINNHMDYKAKKIKVDEPSGLVMPYGDSPFSKERIGENVYIYILNTAKDYVYIMSPFLIISEKMIYAMQMAVKRGVDVRIILPGKYEWKRAMVQRVSRSYYKYLSKSGVKIYEDKAGYLHAKSFVSDDKIAVVGTMNLDYRSLYLHFECAVLLYKTDSIQAVKEDTLNTLKTSNEMKHNPKERLGSQFADAIIHIFAPLM